MCRGLGKLGLGEWMCGGAGYGLHKVLGFVDGCCCVKSEAIQLLRL